MTEEPKKQNPIIKMLIDGEKGISKFRNLIGIGVILMLLSFSFIYINALKEQREIAESCGFTDGPMHCVCTQDAWDIEIERREEKRYPIQQNNEKDKV